MKRALVFAAAIALGTLLLYGLISFLLARVWAKDDVAASAARSWPGGMGTLSTAAGRYPPLQANEACARLTALVNALPKSEAIDEFVAREVSRGELAIGEPPALPDVAAIRELLLRETVVWKRDEGIGGGDESSRTRGVQMTAARALLASALGNARKNDPGAWDDLHAVWKLARSLDGYPQMMTQTAALSMVRMINAVAWKMPLPAPAWFAELQARDSLRPLLEAYQHQTASYWGDQSRILPTRWLADSVEHDRRIAEELFKATHCDVTTRMNDLGTDLSSVWRRAFRYRAEREATANALRAREGKPIESASRCSDGSWSFDGTALRFSRAIVTAPPDRPMPLVLRIKP